MEEEKKYIIKLKKVPLASERAEIKENRKKKLLIVLLCLFIFVSGFFVGAFIFNVRVNDRYTSIADDKFNAIKDYLENVWLYKDNYEDLEKTLNDKAYFGMMTFEEDPYTTYMSYEEMLEYSKNINMNYIGIGVQYYNFNDIVLITKVFKDSPAFKAGILSGDIIKKVDGISLKGATNERIKELVLGEKDTKVVITVERNNEEYDIDVIREEVYSTVYAKAIDDCVLLEIMSFGENTAKECINYLEEYKDYHKLIIDLRSNGGGYQSAVQEVASLFLGENKIVMRQIYNNDKEEITKTIKTNYYDNFEKIIILTDGNTASASEVLTLALKEGHPDCISVGEKTYGKGVVQTSYYLKDYSSLKITTSAWLSPSGESIEGKGIKPDIEVKLDDIFYMTNISFKEDQIFKYDEVSTFIKISQLGLEYIGYDVSRNDGYFDESFIRTLNEFKKDNDLPINDVLDYDTYKTIISKITYLRVMDETKDPQLQKAKELLQDGSNNIEN